MAVGPRAIFCLASDPTTGRTYGLDQPPQTAAMETEVGVARTPTQDWMREMIYGSFGGLPTKGGSLAFLIGERWCREVLPRLPKWYSRALHVQGDLDRIQLLSNGAPTVGNMDFGAMLSAVPADAREEFRLAVWFPDKGELKDDRAPTLARVWRELGLTTLPFDEDRRGEIADKLYPILSTHLDFWRDRRKRQSRRTK